MQSEAERKRGGREWAKVFFEEIMAKSFPKVMKTHWPTDSRSSGNPMNENWKKNNTLRHIKIQMLKTKTKDKTLEADGDKWHATF